MIIAILLFYYLIALIACTILNINYFTFIIVSNFIYTIFFAVTVLKEDVLK